MVSQPHSIVHGPVILLGADFVQVYGRAHFARAQRVDPIPQGGVAQGDGLIMALTIIGLPWTPAASRIAAYTLLPFGSRAISRAEFTGREDVGTGPLGLIGNILWRSSRAGGWRWGTS